MPNTAVSDLRCPARTPSSRSAASALRGAPPFSPSQYPFTAQLHEYVDDVLSGAIPACKWVKLACERHLKNLKQSENEDWPYRFDPRKVETVCRFASLMRHVKGKWAGQRIKLEPWQIFWFGSLFGWVRKTDGLRRFREGFCLIPRKNAKSTGAAVIGNFMLCADGEKGGEVYSGAGSLDQALEVFRPAWQMVERDTDFRDRFSLDLGGTTKNPGTIYRLSDGSRFAPVIGKPGDGASPHCGIVDEYHEQKSPELFDTLLTGMGARSQPLLLITSTAGVDTSVPCYDKQLEAEKVLEGVMERDDLFALIYTIDADDDWTDFNCWIKANPNFGVSIYEDFLRARHKEAMSNPARKNILLTKHLNLWQNAGQAWMDMLKWEGCKDSTLTLDAFAGQDCWLGLDLANRIDITALRIIFRHEDGFVGFGRYYLPEDTIRDEANSHYRQWLEQGWLTETDGATTDFRCVFDDLEALCRQFNVRELAYDPREATFLIQKIKEQEWAGFDCVEILQNPANLSEPTKEFERLIYAGEYHHCGDPVMTWMMSNCVLKQARGGGPIKTYFLTKERNAAKIDGPVAEIMALSRALRTQREAFVGVEVWD